MAASTFSYAQAAKGMSTPVTSSKPTSGAVTPAKDTISTTTNGSVGSGASWAEEAQTETAPGQSTSIQETQSQVSSATPAQPPHSVETSSISSPDLGASSASTVTKDDDVSSLPNASSESTWDNKSQASTSVDKSAEPVEKTSEKVKKGKNAVVKPLQEAPLPAVNIWKKRADELKSKIQKPTPSSLLNEVPSSNGSTSVKKNDSQAKGQSMNGTSKPRNHDDDRSGHARKDARAEADAKRDGKGKAYDKDAKRAGNAQPPPPKRDQESWPTPETVINEDRKKAQEKGEKIEKEQKENTSTGSHGKHEWVKVPYTPSVVFSTPLPNAAGSRRGGRPGGRGGSQPGGRSPAYATNGVGPSEKEGSTTTAVTNGDHTRRERIDGETPRDASPKSKRPGSATSPTLKDQVPAPAADKTSKSTGVPTSEAELRPRNTSSAVDATQNGNQNSGYPRQYPNRSNKSRRGDLSFAGERRKEGDASPKDNTFDDRRPSVTAQTEASGEGERRATAYHDGSNGAHHKQGRFGSYSEGRERGRGGARGGRGFAHGHQFSNGHVPAQSSSFSMGPRSPVAFNPENPSFFAAPQGKYGRNGHRSQSVANDPYRFAPYQAGPPVPPLQTYNMYDYSMMQQPMSAVPYTPYVDQYALFSMITTQVEYYFSVDNLLKDMYLRRRMDSQGFVSLEFIAGFNRIKQLSTDIELVKLVCQQSSIVQYRTGEDGQDRLRRREGWEQWVLNMADRDAIAQNEGPKELHQPPVPQPHGFDQSSPPQWPMSAVDPTGSYGGNAAFPSVNGFNHGISQDGVPPTETLLNGTTSEGANDGAALNGHANEASNKAVSPESDSFSDAQIASLTVVVRKQDALRPPFTSRSFSNGSIDSNNNVQYASEEKIMCQVKVHGTGSSECSIGSDVSDPSSTDSDPFRVAPSASVRLYWVKDSESPVQSIPPDSAHESYFHLRSKALRQRNDASLGTTPYDMDVLYQFWSHFLLRNFNTRMYDEFRYFAFEDVLHRMTNVGLSNLIKFYGEALLSPHGQIQDRIVRHFVDLVRAGDEYKRPAFEQLQVVLRSDKLDPSIRKRIVNLLDEDLLAALDL